IREQNLQAAPGAIGQQPAPATQQFQYTLRAQGRLEDVRQFENIILVANPDGSVVRLKDVSRIELGAENYGWFGQHSLMGNLLLSSPSINCLMRMP
ncbi:MAG: hypothetical protein GTO41_08960, partial [Burkholderiales bacterium]|nr:hypothetical protein [Burkholderiales bacterium]